MRILLMVISIGGGMLLEWSVGQYLKFWSVAPPLTVFFLLFWFWRLRVYSAFFLGMIIGFFMDNVSIFPYGTHLLIFMLLVFLTEFLRSILSFTESLLVQGLSIGVGLFSYFILSPLVGFLWNFFSPDKFLMGVPFYKLLLAAVVWSCTLPALFFGIIWLARFLRTRFKLGITI